MKPAAIFIYVCLGAALASGWWATILYQGVPIGPNNFPLVGILTGIATAFLILWCINTLCVAAFGDN